jgi:hypothetical protein
MDMFHEGDTYKMEYTGGNDSDYTIGTKKALKENGDFRSAECIALLKEADIIITNPPFSLFREYVAQLMGYEKKFLIIGNKNAITYKDIFPLIKGGRMWLGYKNINSDMWLLLPENCEKWEKIIEGKKAKHIMACWFTNFEISKRSEKLILYKTYKGHESDYPKYDNYDAIEVSKVQDIPVDYKGVMGVPITFLDKYNPGQFDIVKFRKGDDEKDLTFSRKCDIVRQQTADSRQQTADSRQQTADSRQQTADSRQQTADSRQQTADRIQPYFRILIRYHRTERS